MYKTDYRSVNTDQKSESQLAAVLNFD